MWNRDAHGMDFYVCRASQQSRLVNSPQTAQLPPMINEESFFPRADGEVITITIIFGSTSTGQISLKFNGHICS